MPRRIITKHTEDQLRNDLGLLGRVAAGACLPDFILKLGRQERLSLRQRLNSNRNWFNTRKTVSTGRGLKAGCNSITEYSPFVYFACFAGKILRPR